MSNVLDVLKGVQTAVVIIWEFGLMVLVIALVAGIIDHLLSD